MFLEVLLIVNILLLFLGILLSYWFYYQNYLILEDNANAFKMLMEYVDKNFQKNLEDHENIIKIIGENDEKIVTSLTENDQKIADLISENQKNLINLAFFLGYRPKNLEDI